MLMLIDTSLRIKYQKCNLHVRNNNTPRAVRELVHQVKTLANEPYDLRSLFKNCMVEYEYQLFQVDL